VNRQSGLSATLSVGFQFDPEQVFASVSVSAVIELHSSATSKANASEERYGHVGLSGWI